MSDFLYYWKPETAKRQLKKGGTLNHVAGQQLSRVHIGDTLWIVTVCEGTLNLIGRLIVDKIVNQKDAEKILGDNLWESEYHALSSPSNEKNYDELDLTSIINNLQFETSGLSQNRLSLIDGKVNPQQLQTMRLLTVKAAKEIQKFYNNKTFKQFYNRQNIKYVLRDEKINIFMMTEGSKIYPDETQIFLCKKEPFLEHFKNNFVLLDSKRLKPTHSLSEFGSNLNNQLNILNYQYAAIIDSEIKIKVTQDVFNLLSCNHFSVWKPEAPFEYFKDKKEGYIILFRVYQLNNLINENFLKKGRSGKSSLFNLYDQNNYLVEVTVDIGNPVLSDYDFLKIKNNILNILRDENAIIDFINNTTKRNPINIDDIQADEQLILAINEPTNEIGTKDIFQYVNSPRTKQQPEVIHNQKIYKRDRNISTNALIKAKFCCEIDKNHQTFQRKISLIPYTEPHHLIPMSYSDYFDYSLDVEENIVSLCSHCHNNLHYGNFPVEMLQKLYDERIEHLRKAGISISFDELLEMY